ncbi:hypothetical protein [Alistipes shahii]|uniref:hypothetical protein n=1 Tax=Alistipes shahii TaxID=328814 RepID=UPI003AABA284
MIEVGHCEIRFGKVAVFYACMLQVALVKYGFPAVYSLDQGIRQIGFEKVRFAHVGCKLLLESDVGVLEVGFLEVDFGEIVPVGESVGQRFLENPCWNHPQQGREYVNRLVAVKPFFRSEEPPDEDCRSELVSFAVRGKLADRRVELFLQHSAAGGFALNVEKLENDQNSADKQRNDKEDSFDMFQDVVDGVHG